MVISDSPPQPLLLAREMGLVSALITNFLWDRVYRRLLGPLMELELIARAYASATFTWVLPFEVDPPAGHAVSLVTRPIRRTRREMRRQLGIHEREVLAFLSTGQSMILSADYFERVVSKIAHDRVRILSSTWRAGSGVLAIPKDDVETQDCVAACDVVVGKAGYGTLAEAVQARVPLLLFDNVVEGAPLVDIVERLGIGKRIPPTAYRDGTWVEHLRSLGHHRRAFSRLPERLMRDGAAEIASEILCAVRS